MKSLQRSSLLLILIYFFNPVFAQKNFIPGYIVDNKSDTIFGLIDYKNWGKNPKLISFKKDSMGIPQKYSPVLIRSFKVADQLYVSKIVTVDKSPTTLQDLKESARYIPDIVKDSVFLTLFIKGKATLYYFMDDDLKEHYYIEKDTIFEELILSIWLRDYNGTPRLIHLDTYKHQLESYLGDRPELRKAITSLEFNRRKLTSLFKQYNEVGGAKSVEINKVRKLRLESGVMAGLTSTRLKFEGNEDVTPFLIKPDYGNSVNPSFGVFCNVILPGINGRWSIKNDLQFANHQFKGVHREIYASSVYDSSSTYFGMTYFKLSNMLCFQVRNHKKLRPYIFAGICNSLLIKNDCKQNMDSYIVSQHYTSTSRSFIPFRNLEQSYLLGVGLDYKNIRLEYRYLKGNGISASLAYSSRLTTNLFLISYTLFR